MAEGTGGGSASVYGIVAQSGGGVRVWSEPEKGADFDIAVPLTPSPERAEAIGDDFLAKPLTPEDLADRVRRLLPIGERAGSPR